MILTKVLLAAADSLFPCGTLWTDKQLTDHGTCNRFEQADAFRSILQLFRPLSSHCRVCDCESN